MPAPEERERVLDHNHRLAERAHDRHTETFNLHQQHLQAYALMAMRAPAFVAAGGIAATLGYYSANASALSDAARDSFGMVLLWLFLSLLVSVLAPALAYLAEFGYLSSLSRTQLKWDLPFTSGNGKSKFWWVVGEIFRNTALLAVAASILTLVLAGREFLTLASS